MLLPEAEVAATIITEKLRRPLPPLPPLHIAPRIAVHAERPTLNLAVEQLLRDVYAYRLPGLAGGDDPDVAAEGRFVDLAGMDKVEIIEIDHPLLLLLPRTVQFATPRVAGVVPSGASVAPISAHGKVNTALAGVGASSFGSPRGSRRRKGGRPTEQPAYASLPTATTATATTASTITTITVLLRLLRLMTQPTVGGKKAGSSYAGPKGGQRRNGEVPSPGSAARAVASAHVAILASIAVEAGQAVVALTCRRRTSHVRRFCFCFCFSCCCCTDISSSLNWIRPQCSNIARHWVGCLISWHYY
mmetsp:Transcript_38267/g.77963  ORF Transcript_38267/g.77963 Transcript_38267/m.77963 type:complete len:303 (-) Transcript_38267:398-1306(-)